MFKFELYFSLFLMLLLYLIGFFLVETSKKGVFFGIRIPAGCEKNEKLRSLKKEYRINYTLSSIAFWAVYAVFAKIFTEQFPLVMILSIFAFLVVLNSNYYITHKKVKQLKKVENWKLDSPRIVVVDTSFREMDHQHKRIVISPWWFLIPVSVILINIVMVFAFYKGLLTDMLGLDPTHTALDPGAFTGIFIMQASLTVLFFLIYKVVKKAKQQLNGGDIHVIRHQSRSFRYVASALFMLMALIFNINYLLSSMSMLGIIKLSEKSYILMLIAVLFIPMFALILTFGLLGQDGRYITVKSAEGSNQLMVNRDDDDNYLLGSLYYNKYDPALMVEKRVGIGWDFNYARPAAKIIMGLIAALLILVLFMLSQLPKMTRERNIQVTGQEISISGAWGLTIDNDNIQKITLESVMPEVVMRTNGAAIGNKLFGRFKLKDIDKATLFISDKNKPLIIIYLKNNEAVLVNYEDTNKTEQLYRKILDTANLE